LIYQINYKNITRLVFIDNTRFKTLLKMSKNTKSIKEKLVELFQLVKKESFLDAKAADGSILRTTDDAFKTGSQVVLISEDGTSAPAPDGPYTLEDGSSLVIKSSVVESITPADTTAAAPAPDTTAANPTSDAPATMADAVPPVATATPDADGDGDMGTMIEIIKNITDRLSALEDAVSATKMSVEKMNSAAAPEVFKAERTGKQTAGEYLENWKKEYKAKNKTLADTTKQTTETFSKVDVKKIKNNNMKPIDVKDIFKNF